MRWNGRAVPAYPGETVAAALWRAGVTTLARSHKLHRPLGLSGCYPVGVLARVDGVPNTRLDVLVARAGLEIEMQNAWPSPRLDVLRAMQLLPSRWVYGGFEHGALVPESGFGFHAAERLTAFLAGMARPAAAGRPQHAVPARTVQTYALVTGGGPAAIAQANLHANAGRSVALVTRGEGLACFAGEMGRKLPTPDPNVRVFPGLELFGRYRDGTLRPGAPCDAEVDAVVFRPRSTILAIDRRSVIPMVHGNALPGVLDAHAALDLAATLRSQRNV